MSTCGSWQPLSRRHGTGFVAAYQRWTLYMCAGGRSVCIDETYRGLDDSSFVCGIADSGVTALRAGRCQHAIGTTFTWGRRAADFDRPTRLLQTGPHRHMACGGRWNVVSVDCCAPGRRSGTDRNCQNMRFIADVFGYLRGKSGWQHHCVQMQERRRQPHHQPYRPAKR